MANSPLPISPPPGVPDAPPFPRLSTLAAKNLSPNHPPNAAAIFNALGEVLSINSYPIDQILSAIAEAAQALTEASAAAVALNRDGVVICCGRSGEIAPELGSRLSVDSGVSGECLRTGKILRCDDTLRDYHADPEVCRRLGLRSIAVVPVRCEQKVVGIVEAFSPRTYAFAEEHMDALRQLATLTESAYAREAGIPAVTTPASPTVSALTIPDAPHSRDLLTRRWDSILYANRWIAAGVVAMMVLVGLLAFRFWPKWTNENSAQAAVAPVSVSADTTSQTVGTAALVWKPSPQKQILPPQASGGIQRASLVEKQLSTAKSQPPVADSSASQTEPAAAPVVPDSTAASVAEIAAPTLSASASEPSSSLRTLVSAPANMPEFTAPVSQGVSPGVLIHRVQPLYPAEALPLHLQGAVVLQATITEEGAVKVLKIVSGQPLLARAASDAVSQWRYSPYLLNGKPTAMQTEITISFKARQ